MFSINRSTRDFIYKTTYFIINLLFVRNSCILKTSICFAVWSQFPLFLFFLMVIKFVDQFIAKSSKIGAKKAII